MNVRRVSGIPFVLVVCLGISVSGARAQQTIASASVSGTVIDATDAVMAAATLHLVNRETNQAVDARADGRGRFRFVYVPVGSYRLSASAPGFAMTSVDLDLGVGQALDVPLRLTVAATNESVNVTAQAPLIEAARTAIAELVTPREVDSLPLNGRNYLDLALLVPNVSRTNTRNNDRFAETSAVPGTGLSVASQRNIGNTFIVDGLSANDDAADLAGTSFAEEVIREFQVITSGATAEFGRASTGIINVVTQSGTNRLRGRTYGFLRNERFDARNALATRKDPLTQSQYGLTLGGPVIADRTFWFANAERTQQDKNGVVTIAPANVAAINGTLARVGYPGPSISTGEFLTGYHSTNVFGRLDHVLATGSRLHLRYSLYDVTSRNARGVGGLGATTRGTSLDNMDQSVASSWQTSLGTTMLSDLRALWTRSHLNAPPNDLVGPAVSISGVANLGTGSSSPTERDLGVFQLTDTVTMQRGNHLVKTGVDLLYDRVTIVFPGALQGSYTFTSLANLQRGVYQQYQQAFGEPSLFQSNPNLGVFVQDEWTLHPSLTLNAGLRYDLQWLPAPIAVDANNISPRAGVAWASADRETVVRASGGMYFDRTPLRATSNALQRDGIHYRVAALSFGQEGAPVFPNVLSAFPAGVVTAITTIDPELQNGRSEQAGVQIERAVGRATTVAAAYAYQRGHNIIMSRNVNVPTLTAAQAAAQGILNLGRPNPNFANISRFEAIGDAWFHGLTLSLNARPGTWGSARLSYTLSRALDTAGNAFFSTPQNNFDIEAEKGPSDNDQRHRLVVSGTVGGDGTRMGRALGGVEFGYVASYATGVPFNVVAGSDLNNDTNNNDRPAGVTRNSERQPSTSSVDVRAIRSFRIAGRQSVDVLIEVFNVFNRVNILALNSTFGTGAAPLTTFGQPTLAGDPRQIQVGLRWNF
jgi:hypothetical protein